MKFRWTLSIFLTAACASLAAETLVTNNPYGVCAHVSRSELELAPKEFVRFHEAGINWVRTDFDWSRIQKKQGEWNFAHLDKLLELSKQDKINVLPILDYDVAWAKPAWQNLDIWSEYVNKTVSRYHKDLRCWEVWNEQNHEGFWKEASGKNYAILLKRTYEEIKKIDPELTVLYGGTAGVPLSYIEDSYAAGAGAYFDVMNIHPYNWMGVPEDMIKQIDGLKNLMKKYNLEKKPIWITEVGWSTAKAGDFYQKVLPTAFKRAGIDLAKSNLAVVNDPDNGGGGGFNFSPANNINGFKEVKSIKLKDLATLDAAAYPVLMPALSEEFPSKYIPDLLSYLKAGGTLLLPAGLPFYFDIQEDANGGFKKVQVNNKYMKTFHMDWEAWWTKKGVPEKEKWQKPAPGFEDQFKVEFKPSSRFLTAANLKEGDEFIPVLMAGTDDYQAPIVAVYKLNSDLKGNIIVCTPRASIESVPESRQAEMLPRTYIIALANGVERVFWYNFRSAEWKDDEREAHFGIVRKDLSPKPSFQAYKTLTSLCPSGSTVPLMKNSGSVYLANWKRPDGVNVWALWSSRFEQNVKLEIKGKVSDAVNHLGEKQTVPASEYKAAPALLYIVGPDSITIPGL